MIAAWCAIAATAAGRAHAGQNDGKNPAADPMPVARDRVKTLYDAVWHVERLLKVAANRAVRSSCVEERLAEAKAHLRLGTEELARITDSVTREHTSGVRVNMADERDARAYALTR